MRLKEVIESTPLARDIWTEKYQYNGETYEGFLKRVSGGDIKVAELIDKCKFLFGGRILAGRGTTLKTTFSNCYFMKRPEDNLESIFKVAGESGKTFSFGGGCGICISKLRPTGAPVNNAAKKSTGPISFLEIYDLVTSVISQQGRRGALMVNLLCDHPSLEEFIWIKKDPNKIEHANLSVKCTDYFMNAADKGEKYSTKFVTDTGWEQEHIVDAHNLLGQMAQMAWDMSDPGILYWDNITNSHLLSEDPNFELAGTNPCVIGTTLLMTDKGNVPIQDLVGKDVTVWNGYEWSVVTPKVTSTNQHVLTLVFSDGAKIKCTPNHKFVIEGIKGRVEAKDLESGMMVAKPNPFAPTQFTSIVEVIDDGEIATKVYCATEPKNNTLVFNGIMTGNCGELPLPEYGACLLGSINLSEFVLDPFTQEARIDYDDLCKAIRIAVRALNVVLDEGIPRHPLPQQQQQAADWRPIGLGIMGYADMCLKLGEKYTNVHVANGIASIFINEALQESAEIAKEFGVYPNYNSQAVLNSMFLHRIASRDTYEKVKEYGLRNSALLAVAPTGSISTMLGVSGGVEPIFDVAYMRKTQSLHGEDTYYKVYTPIIEEVIKVYGSIPDFVQTAHTILPDERIAVQSTWQKYVDSAISSTINLPKSATPHDIKNIFINAWRAGCKGITVHRAGNRRGAILGAVKPLERGEILEAQDNYIGRKRKLVTGCGNLWCMAFFDPQNKEMREVFLSKGSTGGCNSFMVGLSRMASMAVRGGVPLEAVVEQLESSGTCPSYASQRAKGVNVSKGNCCPSAVGKALLEMQKELREMAVEIGEGIPCPECGSNVSHQEGCTTCKNCGWSKCS